MEADPQPCHNAIGKSMALWCATQRCGALMTGRRLEPQGKFGSDRNAADIVRPGDRASGVAGATLRSAKSPGEPMWRHRRVKETPESADCVRKIA